MLAGLRPGKHFCPECHATRKNKRDIKKDCSMEDQFWAQVDRRGPSECWHWLGSKTRLGYGRPMFNGQRRMAHRWALEFETGDNGQGRVALHSCDNPRCVNPAHLRWGTQLENIQDRVSRGRNGSATGEGNGSAKLTVAQVRAIRADARPSRAVAAEYGVSQVTICAIKRRTIWSHIDGMDPSETGQASVPGMQPHAQKQKG